MADYRYRAIDAGGRERTGRIAADGEGSARQQLAAQQYHVLELTIAAARPAFVGRRRMSARQLMLFTRQFSTLITVSPLEEALRTVSQQSENAKASVVLSNVHKGVVEGQSLATAMKREEASFPSLYRAMIAAGEKSGALPDVAMRLSQLLERQADMRSKLLRAITYPSILAVFAFAVVLVLMLAVVPKITAQFDLVGQKLPLLTRTVMAFSNFLSSYWWVMLAIGIAVCAGVFVMMRDANFARRADGLWLRSPLIGSAIRKVHAARISRTLAVMAASHVPILDGLKLVSSTVQNSILRQDIDQIAEAVRGGSSLSSALQRSEHFPALMVNMAASGEAAGQLDVLLERAADYLERDIENFTDTALTLLEPAIIIAMGGIVAVIILSILLPILELQNLTAV